MALSHSSEWAKQADEAIARRAKENRLWRKGCKVAGCNGSVNPKIGLCFQHFLIRNTSSNI